MNPDLLAERRKSNFNVSEMTLYLYGPLRTEKFLRAIELTKDDPAFDTSELWYISNTERYTRACSQAESLIRLIRNHNLIDDKIMLDMLQLLTGEDFFLMLHLSMFLQTLQNLCDSDQLERWLKPARDFRILGTYVQTEIGHGSNVAGLGTTAELDFNTDEWVLNTPSLESYKWWSGGLAKSVNCCIILAKLIIRGKNYGIHAFFLPLRDFDTHRTHPGITLVDVGQKMGYNGMDNGGMRLQDVRIPRQYLLQRYVEVDREGNFTQKGGEKMLYATMTFTRKEMLQVAGVCLARACTIAVRYSAIRRQFPDPHSEITPSAQVIQEAQIIDYFPQQYKIFPFVATAIGFSYAAYYADKLYNTMLEAARTGDYSRIKCTHILTSALKCTMTTFASDGIEVCRKSLGGHGFLLSSGLPLLFTSYVAQVTYEGDAVVLAIQCGKGLMTLMNQKLRANMDYVHSSVLPDSPQRYIAEFDLATVNRPPPDNPDFLDPEFLCGAFERRTCILLFESVKRMESHLMSGLVPLAALDEEKVALVNITHAHSHATILRIFQGHVNEAMRANRQIGNVLLHLMLLYGAYWAYQTFVEFAVSGVFRLEDYQSLLCMIKKLLRMLRPHMVSLVDAWQFPDTLLNSVLGRYDGRAYEALWNAAQREPRNDTDVAPSYEKHIKYILHPDRKKKTSRL